MKMTCSQDMCFTASEGCKKIISSSQKSICDYLLSSINHDGGFCGRSKQSDIYYSVFGLASLLALESEYPLLNTYEYLNSFADGEGLDLVHLVCLLRSRCIVESLMAGDILETGKTRSQPVNNILESIEEFRSLDGGYNHFAKMEERATVYALFLVYLAYTDAGCEMPERNRFIKSLESLRLTDGSFANTQDTESGSTTSTAAAVVLQVELMSSVDQRACECLLSRLLPEGGFAAGEKAAGADLLSTATALYALKRAGGREQGLGIGCRGSTGFAETREFVERLWNEDGGFSGSEWDEQSDCEYTFYALLALGCL